MNDQFYLLLALWIGGGLLCLLLLILIKKLISKTQKFPYKKKRSILTPSEQKCYRKLLEEYGDQYYIFPQLNLDKIIEVTDSVHYYSYFNKINQKSVDFVLVDKQTFAPIEVIELDDLTHLLKRRKVRDEFVNTLLMRSNINIQRIANYQ